jgi:hypothetical protein
VAREPRLVEFRENDLDQVLTELATLAERQAGWVNLAPDVDEGSDAKAGEVKAGIFRVFSGVGPAVPHCTWVAPQPKQRPPHAEIGLLHRSGPKVVRRLEEQGHAVPEGWVVLADHPKRGLVVAIPPGTTHREVLSWLIDAANVVTQVPLPGRWKAAVHES